MRTEKIALAAINKEDHEKHRRNNQARDSNGHGKQEDYLTQLSEENEDRVTTKLWEEISGRERGVLGALHKIDELLLNPQAWDHQAGVHSVLETFWSLITDYQETNEDHSQNDTHHEARVSLSQSSQNLSPDETSRKIKDFCSFCQACIRK